MASRADRELATIAAYAYELARQQKQWYLKYKPSVKQVHPLYDDLFLKSKDAMSFIINKYDLNEKDLIKIKKKCAKIDVFMKKIHITPSVMADFINKLLFHSVTILYNSKKGDIEKFVVMNAVLIASDELCNYFDQRVKRQYLSDNADKLFKKWKSISI